MNIKKINIAKDELIGKKVKIKECTDPNWEGKKGLIVDETKNTFLIKMNNKEKRIGKKTATFEFIYKKDKKIEIKGSNICYKPENRIKKIR